VNPTSHSRRRSEEGGAAIGLAPVLLDEVHNLRRATIHCGKDATLSEGPTAMRAINEMPELEVAIIQRQRILPQVLGGEPGLPAGRGGGPRRLQTHGAPLTASLVTKLPL